MAISTENRAPCALAGPETRDVGRELVYELVFRAPAAALVRPLARLGVPPPAVVLANASAGLAAAAALVDGRLLLAAVLLQLKTLLDNVDGNLARATANVTLSGRFLDTEADFVVNAALFAALATATGSPVLALLAFVVLTAVLTANFQLMELNREVAGTATAPRATGGRVERALAAVYAVVFAPQDRLARALSERRFERLAAGAPPERREAAVRAYHNRVTGDVVANLGLSTQLLALGVCLALGAPEVYLWLVLASPAVVLGAQVRRERLARRTLEP